MNVKERSFYFKRRPKPWEESAGLWEHPRAAALRGRREISQIGNTGTKLLHFPPVPFSH